MIKKAALLSLQKNFLLPGLEIFSLGICGVALIIMLLGHGANRLAGTALFANLLPFAVGILGLMVLGALLLSGWQRLRIRLQRRSPFLPAIVALALALLIGGMATHDRFFQAFGHFRTLVGGREEVTRVALAHQVYATYRRLDTMQLQRLINRSKPYQEAIGEAAAIFAIDEDLLRGLAATESSFFPRTSADGGRGLFQITQVPAAAASAVDKLFDPRDRSLDDSRYNAFLGAATLSHYLKEMKGDLFLGLLAYNIGPKNGGLRFIMQEYGAADFMTIQPYLQVFPRDYPIKVLSYALAFRIHDRTGRLLAYEKGRNASRIQGLGIPGL